MSTSASYLLYSRVPVQPEHRLAVAARLAKRDRSGTEAHATLVAMEGEEVMELTAFASLEELPAVLARRADAERGVAAWLAGEWRHEVLGHVEDVVPGTEAITSSPMLEMRHIEVPPPVYCEYRDWRERTIYAAVRDRAEIDDFRSYQSVLSTAPGVMFVVGFSTAPDFYRTVYDNPVYAEILRQAGRRYIAGGPAGLDCRMFARPHVYAAQREALYE